ncbi:MAG TPA: NAD(P)/FAD-dependent oxidoreductase [Deltaproteobacteria bacterium]|nr:NAD(P)/FAD-dependent oxidoreductase [Deltaproteobacteria bacterium]
MERADVIVIGAGAAGLMCALSAGRRQRKVLVLDHAARPGQKLLVTGGGRCNFTNYHLDAANYLSHNPHFCKSALSRFSQWDFIDLVKLHCIPFHEREQGRLFCDGNAREILDMLLGECARAGVNFRFNTTITGVEKCGEHEFRVSGAWGQLRCHSLVVATGGLSMPAIGATPFGYRLAEQFGLKLRPTRAGLVPFTLQPADKEKLSPLAGIAVLCEAANQRRSFRENILFTHRGLSGPAILQLSSYWQPGEEIVINLLPGLDLLALLKGAKAQRPQRKLKSVLAELLPKRLIAAFIDEVDLESTLQAISQSRLQQVAELLQQWRIKPGGTEGYRTAEVTLGGVDCDGISSKTMESREQAGLYFVGEVLDVAGWLGGYNLQWAWSSGWCAGQYA